MFGEPSHYPYLLQSQSETRGYPLLESHITEESFPLTTALLIESLSGVNKRGPITSREGNSELVPMDLIFTKTSFLQPSQDKRQADAQISALISDTLQEAMSLRKSSGKLIRASSSYNLALS